MMSEKSVRRMAPCTSHPELDKLLEWAKENPPTEEDLRAKRRSWAIGELMFIYEDMTLAEAQAIVDEAAKKIELEKAQAS